ncbi:MAG: hydrogenase 4 subunit B [Deltaproteobacteria bacterium]|nr:hydrogenase 4 subunit B [Deltaproteobacteria bacterium]
MPAILDLALYAIVVFFSVAVFSLLFRGREGSLVNISFSALAAANLVMVYVGFMAVLVNDVETTILPIGLPELPFYLRLDPLSGYFLTVTALLGFFVSIYSIGYVRAFIGKRSVVAFIFFYSLFMAGMFLVVLSDDAYFFMVSWELMAVSSYFLVAFEDEKKENRSAAFLYIVMAHIGAVFILLSFGIMSGFASGFEDFNGYAFSAMRSMETGRTWALAAFVFAFLGFAAKAGVVPLHVWLPEAHPVAPSNVSALMSGVMLKTAIYGIIRVTFDLLHIVDWRLGGFVLIMGLVSTVMGVLYALMQHDLKRLLAYHSVENIGIILIGIGLSMIFLSFGHNVLSALALTAALYHTLNHAMFKGLLFMGAGAVVNATGRRNLDGLGGLIHKMPWTAAFFLAGCISISALPPFNGFVSEWLIFQAFLLSPALENPLLKIIIPLGAALLALSAALAATCFVKAFGVTFLGHWRGHDVPNIKEANLLMRLGMGLCAFACLALGVLPTFVIGWMDTVSEMLVGARLAESAGEFGWLWLTPVSAERASYSAPVVLIGIISVVLIVYIALHARNIAISRAPLWDCGFEKVTPRMQYTATAFSMPIRRIYGFLFIIKESVRTRGHRFTYYLRIRDRAMYNIYVPIADTCFWMARRLSRFQSGRIQVYLIYSFVTLIVLLVFS